MQVVYSYNLCLDGLERVIVSFEGEQKLSLNISGLLCNENSVCDEFENNLSCPGDCFG